jgi:hypothetical protein
VQEMPYEILNSKNSKFVERHFVRDQNEQSKFLEDYFEHLMFPLSERVVKKDLSKQKPEGDNF